MPDNYGTGATLTNKAADTADVQGVAATAGLKLLGYSIRETAGAGAGLVLRHGTADTHTAIAFETLVSGGTVTRWFGGAGIDCASGIFIDRTTGTTEVTLYTR